MTCRICAIVIKTTQPPITTATVMPRVFLMMTSAISNLNKSMQQSKHLSIIPGRAVFAVTISQCST